ncbi:MAG TPA: LysM peptidoglycan-binding domain-containing protein, partial [Pseudoxanthomonas sp.]|nr:LysM peptidoglycan-binding domain-containing protein [Pseudoxanthomonas sp.]
MTNKCMIHFRAMLAASAAIGLLAGCSSSVVRETSSSSSPSQRVVSKPQYGASVRVGRGDTLYGLAFRNGIDVRDLATWNGIT